ncbi:hypothetical protein [Vibrio agarivorans]|uniref:Uncharacterized protein n=1 Tax=Vibrio agarivorans TaxID=153622 RepID=A0ABT7Y799_9VIBR|nr:hypothetical protein [Vibrio agarivorans]MDN2483921.1 hypothetical protein [Vibrio agarivorans]
MDTARQLNSSPLGLYLYFEQHGTDLYIKRQNLDTTWDESLDHQIREYAYYDAHYGGFEGWIARNFEPSILGLVGELHDWVQSKLKMYDAVEFL